ncbi:hypothetical protein G6011_04185 [Alternaria panax]|uniref:Uncharacterized protein n=1 Tax=Alternaria panax TaxID=48097 RepID=A0AAD4IGP2_9PLEO|nr:hypothetical protein G6011_04185 [Alternaria panax]
MAFVEQSNKKAYYADRLCERARCYIHDFLAPLKDDREAFDKYHPTEEKATDLLTPKNIDRAVEKNTTRKQRNDERDTLKKKKKKKTREEVEERLKKHVYNKAVARFNGNTVNEDYDGKKRVQLLRTMYWT